MRVVFMGTPEFALPALRGLAAKHELIAVVTQPDKPGNRGKVTYSPVKEFALEQRIPLFQFAKIREDGVDALRSLAPDVIVTAAYGQILSREILDIPRFGVLNVHASLLPKYRGSSPIQWAIICGERETGITIMQTSVGLDCGDILLQRAVPILPEDDAESMFEKLGKLGGECICACLEQLACGKIVPVKQTESDASYFPMLKKSDGQICWTENATAICNKIRGMKNFPITFTSFGDKTIKIYSAAIAECEDGASGEIFTSSGKLLVRCGDGAVSLIEVQPEGKKRMLARDYLNGAKFSAGDKFV